MPTTQLFGTNNALVEHGKCYLHVQNRGKVCRSGKKVTAKFAIPEFLSYFCTRFFNAMAG